MTNVKFGNRVLLRGDMYEQEEKFFEYAEKRSSEKIENWLKIISHKVILLDGTKPTQENVGFIKGSLYIEPPNLCEQHKKGFYGSKY